jgi:hypothetical protein
MTPTLSPTCLKVEIERFIAQTQRCDYFADQRIRFRQRRAPASLFRQVSAKELLLASVRVIDVADRAFILLSSTPGMGGQTPGKSPSPTSSS